jgi:hypothetical protein
MGTLMTHPDNSWGVSTIMYTGPLASTLTPFYVLQYGEPLHPLIQGDNIERLDEMHNIYLSERCRGHADNISGAQGTQVLLNVGWKNITLRVLSKQSMFCLIKTCRLARSVDIVDSQR